MKLRWLLLGLVVVLLVVPAGMLTVARVAQPPGGAWVRLVAFTPYALALYVVALMLLLLAWGRGRGRWRPLARTFALAALAGALVHALWLAPAFVGGDVAAARGKPLRVMTVNLMLGQASAAEVVELAVGHRVDVLVLEEVDPAALARLQAAGLQEAFGHDVGEPTPGATGTMVLATRRLGPARQLDTAFGGYETEVAGVTLVAVHPRPPTGDVDDWVADHRAVRRAAYDREQPAMIVGDFNATTDHRVMRELSARGYRDAATAARSRWQPTWPADGQVGVLGVPVPPLVALDHVLVNDGLRPLETRAFDVEGTDHRALLAVLSRDDGS